MARPRPRRWATGRLPLHPAEKAAPRTGAARRNSGADLHDDQCQDAARPGWADHWWCTRSHRREPRNCNSRHGRTPPEEPVHDDRAAAGTAHRPAVHPLPPEPSRVLGQPHQRPDSAAAMVPVLLPRAGPKPLPRDPVRRPPRHRAIPVNAHHTTLTGITQAWPTQTPTRPSTPPTAGNSPAPAPTTSAPKRSRSLSRWRPRRPIGRPHAAVRGLPGRPRRPNRIYHPQRPIRTHLTHAKKRGAPP